MGRIVSTRALIQRMTHTAAETGLLWIAFVLLATSKAVEPVPELAFVLQFLGAGGMVGLVIALVRYGREDDPAGWRWTVGICSAAGGAAGLLVVLLHHSLGWF
jgi:hypothetical protein